MDMVKAWDTINGWGRCVPTSHAVKRKGHIDESNEESTRC